MEFLLLGLRVLVALALYAFLGVLLYLLVRERRSNQQTKPATATLIEIRAVTASSEPDLRGPRTYTLVPGAWLGRDPNCLIRVDDTFASARHARLLWENNPAAWWIEDNASRNGTLVNGERIMRAMLKTNDVIRIGDAAYRFSTSGNSDNSDNARI